MKALIIIGLLILTTSPIYAQEDISDRYDENTEITLRGHIVEIVNPDRGPVLLKVKSEKDNRVFNVVTAPYWFLAKNNILFNRGDSVEITGSKFISPKGEIFIVTRQYMAPNSPPCSFRAADMRPKWRGGMKMR